MHQLKPVRARRAGSWTTPAALALLGIAAAAGANVPPAEATKPDTRMAILEQPITDGHVTSPYGWRVHPILKRRRFHQGVDFGAPEGTPVHAAEDGVIEEIGRQGHYGLYLRIRHCASVQTAYAHLARFAPGLHQGSVVSRGQVIAQVGRTGWATGPHLYYEVIVDGRRVDPDRPGLIVPVSIQEASAQPLAGTDGTQHFVRESIPFVADRADRSRELVP